MKRRGLRAPYACARCGLPKAGHICAVITGRAVGSQVDLKVTKGEVEASRIEGAAHVLHVGGGGQLRDTKGKLLSGADFRKAVGAASAASSRRPSVNRSKDKASRDQPGRRKQVQEKRPSQKATKPKAARVKRAASGGATGSGSGKARGAEANHAPRSPRQARRERLELMRAKNLGIRALRPIHTAPVDAAPQQHAASTAMFGTLVAAAPVSGAAALAMALVSARRSTSAQFHAHARVHGAPPAAPPALLYSGSSMDSVKSYQSSSAMQPPLLQPSPAATPRQALLREALAQQGGRIQPDAQRLFAATTANILQQQQQQQPEYAQPRQVNTQTDTSLAPGAAALPNGQAQMKARLKAQFEATAKCAQITTGMCAAAGTANATPSGAPKSSDMFLGTATTGKKRPSIIDTMLATEGGCSAHALGGAKKPRTTHASGGATSVGGKPQVWSPLRRLSWLAADATPALKEQRGGGCTDASERQASNALERAWNNKAGVAAPAEADEDAVDDAEKGADDAALDMHTGHDGSTTPPPASPLLQLDVRPERRRRHVRTSSNSSMISTSSVHSVQGEGLDENGRGKNSAESVTDRADEKLNHHSLLLPLTATTQPNPVCT